MYVLADCVAVADHAEMSLWPCHGDVEPPLLAQKADFVLGIAAHCAHHDSFFLAALEPIDRPELQARVLVLQQAGEQR